MQLSYIMQRVVVLNDVSALVLKFAEYATHAARFIVFFITCLNILCLELEININKLLAFGSRRQEL